MVNIFKEWNGVGKMQSTSHPQQSGLSTKLTAQEISRKPLLWPGTAEARKALSEGQKHGLRKGL